MINGSPLDGKLDDGALQLLEEVKQEIGQCEQCHRDFGQGNRGFYTCDECGAPLPLLSNNLFNRIMQNPYALAQSGVDQSGLDGSKFKRKVLGYTFGGFK